MRVVTDGAGPACALEFAALATSSARFDARPTAGAGLDGLLTAGAGLDGLLTDGASAGMVPTDSASLDARPTEGARFDALPTAGASLTGLLTAGAGLDGLLTDGASAGMVPTDSASLDAWPTEGASLGGLPTAGTRLGGLPTPGAGVNGLLTAGARLKGLPTYRASIDALPTAGATLDALPTAGSSLDALLTAGASLDALPTAGARLDALPTAGASLDAPPTAGGGLNAQLTDGAGLDELLTSGARLNARPTEGASLDARPTAGASLDARPTANARSPRGRVNGALLTMAAVVLTAHPTLEAVQDRAQVLLAEEWSKTSRLEATGMTPWFPALTTLLPGAWPPDGTAVAYALAWRRELRGGPRHVSAFWGRVRVDGRGVVRFERLTEAIDELGQEEDPPSCTKECGREWNELAARVQRALLHPSTAPAFAATNARRHYEFWAEWSQVTAWLAARAEPAFFSWLHLPMSQSPPYGPATPNTGELLPEWRLPERLRYRSGRPGLLAQGGGPGSMPWRVELAFDTGRLSVARGRTPGEVDDAALEPEPDRTLAPRAVAALRAWVLATRAEKPPGLVAPATGAQTLLLGEPWGASSRVEWWSFSPGARGPATDALMADLLWLAADP